MFYAWLVTLRETTEWYHLIPGETGEIVVDGSEEDEQEEISDLGVVDTYK